MKKKIIIISMALVMFFSVTNISYAKADPVTALKKQITALQAQIKSLTTMVNTYVNENKKLKAEIASQKNQNTNLKTENAKLDQENAVYRNMGSEHDGKIYTDGVEAAEAKFLTFNGTNYVSIDGIIPTLTGLNEDNYKYTSSNSNLYLGVFPVNGMVSLPQLQYYNYNETVYFNKWDNKQNFIINGTQYITGLSSWTSSWGSPWIEYKVNSAYKTLKFKVGIDDQKIGNGITGGLTVYGDGNVLYDSGLLEAQEDAKDVTIDLTNINKIKIEFYNPDETEIGVVMADPVLIP